MNPTLFYKSLSDETRLRCLMLIEHEEELCVCELMAALQEIQPKISRHLAKLRQCGVLVDRRQGQWSFYRINPSLPDWAKSVLKQTTDANLEYLRENLQILHKIGDRPKRVVTCL